MRRITLWLLVTATIFVLLFSYHTSTGDSGAVTSVAAPVIAPTTTSTTASSADTTSAPSTTSTGPAATSSATETYTGESVDTRWGPVQVQISVTDGKITAAKALVYPENNHRDQEINAQAVPVLQQETVASQNADIDMVSGATVTSNGYIESLQSALDQAHLR